MKNIFILSFLIFTSSVFSQEVETIIYIDNSISVNRASKLSMEVIKVIEASNEVGVLILGDASRDGKSNSELYELDNENLLNDIPSICLKDKKSQRPQDIHSIISSEIFSYKLVILKNNKNTQIVPIDLHLFLNVSTFVLKKMDEEVVTQLFRDLKLTDDQFNCVIHLDYPIEKEQYNVYIKNAFKKDVKNQPTNIEIKQY